MLGDLLSALTIVPILILHPCSHGLEVRLKAGVFPLLRALAKISDETVQKRHEIFTGLHVFYLFQQFHHAPRIRTDIPVFWVVHFHASSAISCGVAIRTGISTPALLNASN